MEYTKDIIIDLGNEQAGKKKNFKKVNFLKKVGEHITNHKIITTVIIATIGFIVLDMYLITSFMNILAEI